MNYFAHALHCLDRPYQCAGVATPDWLAMLRPRVRCRSRHAQSWTSAEEADAADLATGVMRHHADDLAFHESTAFGELSVDFAGRIRRHTQDSDGMRPSFLGHILVELLLDDALIAEDPARLDRYYESLARVSPERVAKQVSEMSGQDASELAKLIPRFLEVRFLQDYADDDSLCYRLNQVMRRVRLPELPANFAELIPAARSEVRERRGELLVLQEHPS